MKLVIDISEKMYTEIKQKGLSPFIAPKFYDMNKAVIYGVPYEEYLHDIYHQAEEAKKDLRDNKIIDAFETLTEIQITSQRIISELKGEDNEC